MTFSIGDRVCINYKPLFYNGNLVFKDGPGEGPGTITNYYAEDGCYEIEMDHCAGHVLYFTEEHLERVN